MKAVEIGSIVTINNRIGKVIGCEGELIKVTFEFSEKSYMVFSLEELNVMLRHRLDGHNL